ncbi:MAG: UbiD family decarboxylase [Candidatus Altiarchaeota archaeon]|nr:UbiD family decarboxylase [Candidatus Altiarchaeota archaeon]
MSLRDFLSELEKEGKIVHVKNEVNPKLEAARILKENDGKVVMFDKVAGSDYKVVAGVCGSRDSFAKAMGIKKEDLLFKIAEVIKKPTKPQVVEKAACHEVVEKEVDLSKIPVLTHASKDLGAYVTAGVYVSKNKAGRLNMAFHRSSPISKDRFVARICHRDTFKNLEEAGGELPIAICIGLDPTVLLAASISAGDTNEMEIANSMRPLKLVKCLTNDLLVPADAEIVLEGVLTTREKHTEGPFPDISGTFDVVRDEPVVIIKKITHRKNPIYQGLLPAFNEHRLLMGMPKEPTIFNAVNEVAKCKNVLITPGGCCWLHAIVQIEKKNPDDGMKAAEAAHKGHGSLKHAIVVDDDINIYDLADVEWAIATRMQADKNVKIWRGPGSSLDATAEKIEGSDRLMTAKVAMDATIPWDKKRDKFLKAGLGE